MDYILIRSRKMNISFNGCSKNPTLCKIVRREYDKARYHKNIEAQRKRSREYYHKNREARLEYDKKRRELKKKSNP